MKYDIQLHLILPMDSFQDLLSLLADEKNKTETPFKMITNTTNPDFGRKQEYEIYIDTLDPGTITRIVEFYNNINME